MSAGIRRTKTLSRRELLRIVNEERDETTDRQPIERPQTRADCVSSPRPCPFVSCAHHLYLDVTAHGSLHLNFPDRELHELAETCALDVAERGGVTLLEVAGLMNIVRERVRQIEAGALAKCRDVAEDGDE